MSASRDGTVRLVGGSGQIKGMPGCYERIVAAMKKGVEPNLWAKIGSTRFRLFVWRPPVFPLTVPACYSAA
jgi:hypothetical protein